MVSRHLMFAYVYVRNVTCFQRNRKIHIHIYYYGLLERYHNHVRQSLFFSMKNSGIL